MASREPRRVRRSRRAAAFHAERAARATTSQGRYQAAEYELRSAAKHARNKQQVRELREEVVEHVHSVLQRAEAATARNALYTAKLAETGTDYERLTAALMCLRGAIGLLDDTERNRVYEHYTQSFQSEKQRFDTVGGVE